MAQQEAAQQAQDPLTQIQQRELSITEQEAQAKAQKMAADTALEQAKLELDKVKAQRNKARLMLGGIATSAAAVILLLK